ncbi:carboxypeptidase regulatory-like domain-containing protein [Bryocella elongata]|uniref:carboxypeptidase regulatory-like domain-containing protein n=1 Tax=Bryocella elongata TaxID=863522 RepID=UPI000CDEDEE1|nr:carboxypeptidase regulatory-like domain-containing protein [Bryocella elongata]
MAFAVLSLITLCGAATAQTSALDLARDRSASIQGRIADAEGHPLVAAVVVYGRAVVNGKLDLFAMCSTTSTVEGRYECGSLRPGQYIVSAVPAPPSTSEPDKAIEAIAKIYPRTFSPGTTQFLESTAVSLSHGAVGIADVVVRPEVPNSVKGVLSLRPQHPSFLLRAHVGPFDLPTSGKVEYDPATGNFTIAGVPSGEISLGADWADGGRVHHEYGTATVVSGRANTITLALIGRHRLTGSVLQPSADGLDLEHSLPKTVTLAGLGSRSGWHLEMPIDERGHFVFPDLADGSYALGVRGKDMYVARMEIGGKPVEGDILRLTAEMNDPNVTVPLADTRASVSGRISADEVVPQKTAVLLESLRDSTTLVAQVGQAGEFSFGPLPPGDYRLYAWKDITSVPYRDQEVLKNVLSKSREVHLDNDSKVAGVQLSIISDGR